MQVKANETVMRQGDIADRFYVVESGEFDIFVSRVRHFHITSTMTYHYITLL
jgi:hypothetical protein